MCCPGDSAEAAAKASASEQDGDIKRVSTKDWARSTGYDPVKLFNKVGVSVCGNCLRMTLGRLLSVNGLFGYVCVLQLFKDDIRYLLTMDKLWKKRKAPMPLDWEELLQQGDQ